MSGLLTATAAGAARLSRLVAAACCAALCAGAICGADPADDWRHKVDPEVAAPGEAPREFLVVLGPNGGGKSTLLRLILGVIPCAAVLV